MRRRAVWACLVLLLSPWLAGIALAQDVPQDAPQAPAPQPSIAWDYAVDVPGLTGFRVERRVGEGAWQVVTPDVAPALRTWSDPQPLSARTCYRVRAVRWTALSDYAPLESDPAANALCVSPPTPPPAPLPPPQALRQEAPNLLANADMEILEQGWSCWGQPRGCVWATDQVRSGTRSLGTRHTLAYSGGWSVQGRVPIEGGRTYTAGIWGQSAQLDGTLQLKLEWRDATSTILATSSVGPVLAGTQPWTPLVGLVQAPAGATQVGVFTSQRAGPAGGAVWLDDAVFRLLPQ